jgi:hypothetical protein
MIPTQFPKLPPALMLQSSQVYVSPHSKDWIIQCSYRDVCSHTFYPITFHWMKLFNLKCLLPSLLLLQNGRVVLISSGIVVSSLVLVIGFGGITPTGLLCCCIFFFFFTLVGNSYLFAAYVIYLCF